MTVLSGRWPFVRRASVNLSGMRRPAILFVTLVALASAAGCDNTPVTPSSPAYSQTDLRVGSGAEAVSGATLTVNYTGWFYDQNKSDHKGLVFDTSVGHDSFSFVLGTSAVIPGWDQGLLGMKVGGERRLIIPPSLGYGASRYASIPPNASLIFDIELVDLVLPEASSTAAAIR
jgi:FKBP-type peptidyl-prolyl cis-trans isomerase FkpA